MRPKTIAPIAPQRNQNNASGRMYLATPGRSSAGIFGIVGVWVKLKYQRWPIHITPQAMWHQRTKNTHQSKATSSCMICFSPLTRSPERGETYHAGTRRLRLVGILRALVPHRLRRDVDRPSLVFQFHPNADNAENPGRAAARRRQIHPARGIVLVPLGRDGRDRLWPHPRLDERLSALSDQDRYRRSQHA